MRSMEKENLRNLLIMKTILPTGNISFNIIKKETVICSLETVTFCVTFEAELIGFDTIPKPGFHRHPERV